ncbi:MAG: murein L,D-transpeptidase [Actinobacteria bacterium ATB1]|nr:murein L,D-transpeptidase [Actinobacteria bacterium ATB1]
MAEPGFPTRRRLAAATIAVAGLCLATCTSAAAPPTRPVAAPGHVPAPATSAATTTTIQAPPKSILPAGFEAWSATVAAESVTVRTEPNDAAAEVRTFGATNRFGFDPTVFGVTDATRDGSGQAWLRVQVPEVRPNGTEGWIRADRVTVKGHHQRIVVDLGAHTVSLWSGRNVVAQWSAGIGKASTPTPRGRYYLWTKFLPEHGAAAAYGPGVLGINAMSETLTSWQGSDPLIGIHGTRRGSDLGSDVSHGCVRLDYAATALLLHDVELGAPVEII